jgi:hypothetical protein
MTIIWLSAAALVLVAVVAIAVGAHLFEEERVSSCILDGVCPYCGRPTLIDANVVRGFWPICWLVPAAGCTTCSVKRRLPARVRDHRIEQARAAAKAMEQRANFRRVK